MITSAPPTNAANVKKVMISSTARDLPEHRRGVLDACLRQGMFPIMMEHLPASDADAIAESLRMVNEADIYLGIFAFRYGYIPKGYDTSITEMEYNRAVERGIPRLIFLMHEDHPVKAADVERGIASIKLEAFKERLKVERVVNFFTSSAELQAEVINSLSYYREPNLTAFHYVSDIPLPPKEYIAHPYTLLQTASLIGRQAELNLLTDWVANPHSEIYAAHILSIVAIGGMGKSALTWKWFQDIAPQEMQPLSGRMWWSFYESDASFEHFVTRALAYVSKRTKEDIQALPKMEREAQLLTILDQEPYLIVLDGLERILLAYMRLDAARLTDEDLDQRTAHVLAKGFGLPESATQSFTGAHRLRTAADPHVGSFLRKLAGVRASRILISTRLYPADLQTETGGERGGCKAVFLRGLTDDDALNLWRAFGVSGSRDALLPLFHTFENHPLLIQVLAGVVARDRRTPGDFDSWHNNHPDFNPFQLPLIQARSHVLATALEGLDETAQKVLFTIAAFRMPTSYDTIVALFVGEGKRFSHEDGLVKTLEDLEDRGLLGWDRRANRYDLHPIVRGVTWSGLGKEAKQTIYESLNDHFTSMPAVDEHKVKSLEDLTATIELYHSLIGLERFDDALSLLDGRLEEAMMQKLSASSQFIELLALLFPDGLDQPPRTTSTSHANIYHSLGLGYKFNGQPSQATVAFRRALQAYKGDDSNMVFTWCFLADTLRLFGALYESEASARQGLLLARKEKYHAYTEGTSLRALGLALAVRGVLNTSSSALKQSLDIFELRLYSSGSMRAAQHEGRSKEALSQWNLWIGDFATAHTFAKSAWESAMDANHKRDCIRAARLQGMASLGMGDLSMADERLHYALTQAHTVNFVEEEIPALIGLAELQLRQGQFKSAREFLDDVWEPAERGPFPLYHSDAYNTLAQIERDAGDVDEAINAATIAYRLAWCDGPPISYHWGLEKARSHLSALGAIEPDLPPFDPSGREPIPEVEIDPAEEADDGEDQ